jgi:hypothetical protein
MSKINFLFDDSIQDVILFEIPLGQKMVVTEQGWEKHKKVYEMALSTAQKIKKSEIPADAIIPEFP